MGKKVYRCCVAGCNNDTRYPDNMIKRSHVEGDLKFHYFPKDPVKRNEWIAQVSRGLVDFICSDYKQVCSNHFEFGKPTYVSPIPKHFMFSRRLPTLYVIVR